MVKGIGVDICDLRRIKNSDALAKRILHDDEYLLYQSKVNHRQKIEFLAGRFAVKEAFIKAYKRLLLKDICCLNDTDGKPYIKGYNCHVSISHEKHYVVAFVVLDE